ncbi:MAG: hypothetical protein ACI3ZE_01140 [Candidatus Woodwardiibium sp.]|jgi:hypothetical protein
MRRAAHPKSAKRRSAGSPKQKRKAENGAGRIPPLSEEKPAAVQTGTPTPLSVERSANADAEATSAKAQEQRRFGNTPSRKQKESMQKPA